MSNKKPEDMTPEELFELLTTDYRWINCFESHDWQYRKHTNWLGVTLQGSTALIHEMVCGDCGAMSLLGPLFPVDEDE